MAKRPNSSSKPPRLPSYCLHRASGQAYVKIRRRVTYLGVHGSEASREAYAAIVADLLAGRDPTPRKERPPSAAGRSARSTVREVCDAYKRYAMGY